MKLLKINNIKINSYGNIHDKEMKFTDGIDEVVRWYVENREWWEKIMNGEYKKYNEIFGRL